MTIDTLIGERQPVSSSEQAYSQQSCLPESLANNAEVILAIIKGNNLSLLESFSKIYKNVRLLKSSEPCPIEGLYYASEALRNDKEVVLAAVQQCGLALRMASEALKNDKEVVLAAVRQNGMALRRASEALRNDKEVVLAAVRQNGMALQFVPDAFKDEREIALAAVQQNTSALQYLLQDPRIFIVDPEEVRHDPEKILLQFSAYLSLGIGDQTKIMYKRSDREEPDEGVDDGGILRDFTTRLFDGLFNTKFVKKALSSNNLILPKCELNSKEEKNYLAIGTIFGLSLSDLDVSIGSHFDAVLFEMIYSLTEEDVQQTLEYTQAPQKVIDKLFAIYARNHLHVEEHMLAKILKNEFDDEVENTFCLDIDSKEEFIKSLFEDIFNGTIAMAKGMYAYDDWERITGKTTPEILKETIQGPPICAKKIANALVFEQKNDILEEYFKKWIQEQNPNGKMLQSFLFSLSGSKTLPSQTKITINSHGRTNSLPVWHTCFRQIDVSRHYDNYEIFKAKLEESIAISEVGGFDIL